MKKDFKVSCNTKMMFEACGIHIPANAYEKEKTSESFRISRKTKKKLEKIGITFKFLEKVK